MMSWGDEDGFNGLTGCVCSVDERQVVRVEIL